MFPPGAKLRRTAEVVADQGVVGKRLLVAGSAVSGGGRARRSGPSREPEASPRVEWAGASLMGRGFPLET